MKCAVVGCSSSNNRKASEISFFSFPTDAVIQKQWMRFCGRGKEFNPKTGNVCMFHFKYEDYENNVKYEMGFSKKRLLKRGVIPSIKNASDGKTELYEQRASRIEKRENKKIVELLLQEYETSIANANRCVICQESDPKLILFGLPNDPKMRKKWENVLTGLEYTDSSKVCVKHFTQDHLSEDLSELTSTAIPTIFLKNESDLKTEMEEFQFVSQDEFNNTSNIESEIVELEESRTCGFITAAQNFMLYVINCLNCDATFPIKDWDSFIKHVRDNHQFEDIDMEFENSPMDVLNKNKKITTDFDEYSQVELSPELLLDFKNEEFISCKETDLITLHEGKVNFNEIAMSSQPVTEVIDETTGDILLTNFDTSSSLETDDSLKYCEPRKKQVSIKSKSNLNPEINIETTDSKYVFAFIDLLRSYFRLWYAPKIKKAVGEKTFYDFYRSFKMKYKYDISRSDMFKSVQNIREWYQNMFENEKFKTLTYPQSEYYRQCAEFLPDKHDGKSCEICKRVLPDNLQHFAHKHLEHPEAIANENDRTSFFISGVPKSKIDEYMRARYPTTEPVIFECQLCFKTTDSRRHFIFHIKAHIDVYRKDLREYVCDLCGAAFVRRVVFLRHRRRHTGPIKRKCLICGKGFNDYTLLTWHRKRYHNPIEGTIEDIEKSLKARSRSKLGGTGFYSGQLDPETNKKIYSCKFCPRKYLYATGLNKHVNLLHKKEYENFKKRKEKNLAKVFHDQKVYTCKFCPRKYFYRSSLSTHVKMAHKNEKIVTKLLRHIE